MGLRQLTSIERQRLKRLNADLVEVTLLQPTYTGLKKSILDATAPVRYFLLENGLHNYAGQQQGPEGRVYLTAQFLTEAGYQESRVSLYRPTTKNGDPRIWFSGLGRVAQPDDMLALFIFDNNLWVLNLTQVDVQHELDVRCAGPIWDIVQGIKTTSNRVAMDLLARLREIAARGLLRSVMQGRADTAVGRTLETELGIKMNANRAPDFRGIELKSFRVRKAGKRENRKTLFAQVPNWTISKFKSSTQILDAFGYQRDDGFKLYCTVNAVRPNSQGLYLQINSDHGRLDECSDNRAIGAFASWLLTDLRQSLLNKHSETFWVSAQSQIIDGEEYFQFQDVQHTRKPILSQFDILIEQGEITLDHLIKRKSSGAGAEKGPLFKINGPALELLFPPPVQYNLV